MCTTLIVAIWTAGLGWSLPRTLIVSAVGVAAALVPNTVSGDVAAGAVWLVALAFAAATISVIALGVVDQGEVNRESGLVPEEVGTCLGASVDECSALLIRGTFRP